jgi:hypothetical protein
MFLESGEETATVDVMHYLWNGKWPANRSPALSSATLDGRTARDSIRLQPGRGYTAKVVARDEDNDRLAYSWVVMEESKATSTGGDFEATPQSFKGLLQSPTQHETQFTAPAKPGAYRLFVYVYDGKGHAAHANIPFHVDGGQPTPPANP